MAKWKVHVVFTGYAEVDVEADDYKSACDEAVAIADPDNAHGWECDVEEWWKEDD
jgi:hypothetical protein